MIKYESHNSVRLVTKKTIAFSLFAFLFFRNNDFNS